MKKAKKPISLYVILLFTALTAGIFISFLALRSTNTPNTRSVSLPGFTPDPNATPGPVPTSRPFPSPTNSPQLTQIPLRTPGPNQILFDVPFTPQAPFYEWDNPKLSNGCEEASALMAMSWVKGTTITPEKAKQEIIAISDYELDKYGVFLDTSTKDTFDWIFKGYYGYQNVKLSYDISVDDIKNELRAGNLVIVPVNGQELHNPYYTPPGPERHKVVVVGYDPDNREFITNDPGTIRGKSFRYPEGVFFGAIHDYLTGNDLPLPPKRKAMIVVSF